MRKNEKYGFVGLFLMGVFYFFYFCGLAANLRPRDYRDSGILRDMPAGVFTMSMKPNGEFGIGLWAWTRWSNMDGCAVLRLVGFAPGLFVARTRMLGSEPSSRVLRRKDVTHPTGLKCIL